MSRVITYQGREWALEQALQISDQWSRHGVAMSVSDIIDMAKKIEEFLTETPTVST